jgi:hypothetical protein
MHWPLASQFSAMLQRPEIAFRDPALKLYYVERDRFGQPRPWTGAFAVVYKGIPPHGGPPMAVRVFTSASPERHERYDAISAYLSARRVKCLVDFEYRDESVRAAGHKAWFPLILMDWVQGETLYKWVSGRCREGSREALATAAARWIDLAAELEEAGITHGDLQHANVMVTSGCELKLVDYDGMCVPSLVGRRNLEVGVKPYQHPDRNEQTLLSPELDRFSAMVIYVALKALAADPGLWRTYVETLHHDKLLFRNDDFSTPEASPLIGDLMRSPDWDVRDLVERLVEMVRMSIDRLPPLGEAAHPSFKRIEGLLRRRQWDAAVEALNRRGQFRDAPEDLKPLIQEAYRVVCRNDAWKAFSALPRDVGEEQDRALVKAWNEAVFAGYPPAEQERPRVEEAQRRLTALAQIDAVLRQLAGESALVKTASPLPAGYPRRLQARIEQARHRVLAMEHLQIAVEANEEEEAVVTAWRKAVSLGCQKLVPEAWRRRIDLAEQRLPLVRSIRRIPTTLSADQLDRKLLGIWNEDLLGGCGDVGPWREAYRRAVRRRDLLRRVGKAIRARRDAEIADLMGDPLLADFPLPASWQAAIQSARDRVAKTASLIATLQQDDAATFWERFDARLIRRHRDLFAAYEELLRRWTEKEILSPARLGLGPALGRSSLVCVDRAEGVYCVRWTWPQQRFSEQCILAICPQSPGPGDEPGSFSVYYRLPIDCASWEAGGGSRLIHVQPEWRDGWLAVWAMVDLGFQVFASHPLVLGRLGEAADGPQSGWKGWKLFSSRETRPRAASGGHT